MYIPKLHVLVHVHVAAVLDNADNYRSLLVVCVGLKVLGIGQ